MASMTRQQRLQAIYQGRTPDRSAVKIWGAEPEQRCVHPAFRKVRDLAAIRTDLVLGHSCPWFEVYCGQHGQTLIERREEPADSPEWINEIATYHTPLGNLREVNLKSTCGKPGYQQEYALKDPADIRKLLSMPYEALPANLEAFRAKEAKLGDAGIVQYHVDHPMYALQRMIGSENFGIWSLECEDLLLEAVSTFAGRVRQQATAALAAGIRGAYAWVGPELCIPPLMSLAAFEKYVFAIDKRLCDLIHDGGARVWVHCHGKMGAVLERFAAMGADVLNPIEPAPMGDITLEEAFARVGDRMALEGNIETHDFMTGSKELIRAKIHGALDAGKGRRHILCPSSGYQENVEPGEREIANWLFYIEEGVRYAEGF